MLFLLLIAKKLVAASGRLPPLMMDVSRPEAASQKIVLMILATPLMRSSTSCSVGSVAFL